MNHAKLRPSRPAPSPIMMSAEIAVKDNPNNPKHSDNKPVFDSATFSFSQEGNTVGTTEDIEILTISLFTQLPGEKPFVVLQTDTGWSIDDIEELAELVKRCQEFA